MKVGELFVNLGIKGSDRTIGAISETRKGMGSLASMSLEAKAALVGVFYGLQKLMSISGQMGTSLVNFNALTGISTKELQQFQYAARQAGISGEEMAGSLKSIQDNMAAVDLGKGLPDGAALLFGPNFDFNKKNNPAYVMQEILKNSQNLRPDIANPLLKSFGLSDGVISAYRRGKLSPEILNRAPTYSDGELKSLDRANIAWSNLSNKIQMAIGHMNAAHGGELIRDLTKLTDQVLKLTDALLKMAEKLKVFSIIGKVFDGWTELAKVTNAQADTWSGLANPKTREATTQKLNEFISAIPGALKIAGQDAAGASQAVFNQVINFLSDEKDPGRKLDSVNQSNKRTLQQYQPGARD